LSTTDTGGLSQRAFNEWRRILQTDLWELCQVLYPPPKHYWSESIHRPICKLHFIVKKPTESIAEQDSVDRKQRLYLDPRNHFKTTIDICDVVQWILCFPDVRVLIASGTRDNAIKMLSAVKAHFQYNEVIRSFFPELCPGARKVEEWGRMESFTCPGRTAKYLREPTVSIASPDATVAGMHYDVLKFDDLVNETNSRTAESLRAVIQWYKLTNPLLEPYGYRDVIGTRYDFSDLYGEILGDEYSDEDCVGKLHRNYIVTKRSCFTANGEPIFPERFTRDRLERERTEMGSFNFSAQYLNKPVPSDSQHFPWPLVERAFIDRAELPAPRTYFTTFDLAISQASDADRTAIVTCSIGIPRKLATAATIAGMVARRECPHLYIEDLVVGHLKPLEVVDALYKVYRRFHPIQVRTEQVGFARLLEPIMRTEALRQKLHLPLVWINRDNREAKQARIAGLQPWLERGELHICKDILHREDLVLELVRFPKYRRDDIVDALSDHLQMVSMFQDSDEEPLPDLSVRCGDPLLGYMA
jgi:hypothetical protein